MLNSILDYLKSYNSYNKYPDGIAIVKEDGEIVYTNERFHKIFAINDSYQVVSNITKLIPDIMSTIETSCNQEASATTKFQLDKDSINLDITASFDSKNETFIVAIRLAGSKKRKTKAQKEAEQIQNHTKNDFLVKIASDLTSPLQAIFGFSQALLEGMGGKLSEKQIKYIKIIWKNSKELSDLLEKVLMLSKIESGKYSYNYKKVDFINVLKQIRNDFKGFCEEKRLDCVLDYTNLTKRLCMADEKTLKIILSNFFASSVDNTDIGSIKVNIQNPSIETLKEQGFDVYDTDNIEDYLQFSITDTGNGFNKEEFDKLFNPYAILSSKNKKNLSRSLGLTIAKHFIEDNNGKIWGNSVVLEGTTFNFIIPTEKMDKE